MEEKEYRKCPFCGKKGYGNVTIDVGEDYKRWRCPNCNEQFII